MHFSIATQLFIAVAYLRARVTSTRNPYQNATYDSLARLPSQPTLHPRVTPSTYIWPGGWTMTIRPGPTIVPIGSASAILIAFYNQVMTIAAAKMLTATRPNLSGVDFVNNVFRLDFAILENGPGPVVMEWNMMYWFAAYMQALARMGFTSIGGLE